MLGALREKNLHLWVGGWARQVARGITQPPVSGTRHLLFAFCDHYEPLWRTDDIDRGDRRVQVWQERYPVEVDGFLDADGRPPQHSFFFPGEQYRPEYLDRLGRIAKAGLGEVEVHLHHDGDTRETLTRDLEKFIGQYAEHGHLTRLGGKPRYAFIHGNWCLANSRGDRRYCGVDDEMRVLFDTGCYADFTFPSAPDETQPGIINRIYWPTGDLGRARAYEHGERARVGDYRLDRLLIIEGPLSLRLRRHKLPIGIENANITAHDPGTAARLRAWVSQNIHVAGRPEWVFVKVHTHGAPDDQAAGLLHGGMRQLHEALRRYNDGVRWKLHYVSAREMYNIAIAAMQGAFGDPNAYRNHVLPPPPIRA